MFVFWPEGRVLLAVLLPVAGVTHCLGLVFFSGWFVVVLWGFLMCFVVFSFELNTLAKNCSVFFPAAWKHALSMLCFSSCVEGIGSTGHVKAGQQQRSQNRQERKLTTVYWTIACCIDQKWCCWTAVPLYACVPGEATVVPQFVRLETRSKSKKPNQLAVFEYRSSPDFIWSFSSCY